MFVDTGGFTSKSGADSFSPSKTSEKVLPAMPLVVDAGRRFS
jgi:hypothetical protein